MCCFEFMNQGVNACWINYGQSMKSTFLIRKFVVHLVVGPLKACQLVVRNRVQPVHDKHHPWPHWSSIINWAVCAVNIVQTTVSLLYTYLHIGDIAIMSHWIYFLVQFNPWYNIIITESVSNGSNTKYRVYSHDYMGVRRNFSKFWGKFWRRGQEVKKTAFCAIFLFLILNLQVPKIQGE